ncbi:hypothetical protein Efla_005607 [Eimeria flavescens]
MGGPSRAEEVPEWVDRLVAKHKVTVFSKTYCPYCKKAIAALETLKLDDLHVEQIEKNEYCDAIQDYLLKKTGARSVPRVFVKGQFFGGGDDTVCLVAAVLAAVLAAAVTADVQADAVAAIAVPPAAFIGAAFAAADALPAAVAAYLSSLYLLHLCLSSPLKHLTCLPCVKE